MNKYLVLFLISTLFFSCDKEIKIPSEIAKIPVDIEMVRFDEQFSKSTSKDLPSLKKTFPYLFSNHYPDEYWITKFTDTIQLEINQEVGKAFPDVNEQQEELNNLFKHIKFYYPKAIIPKVITITNDVEYRNKVILADSLLLVSLDTYLGKNHHFYVGIPKFQTKNFRKEQIDVDVAHAFAKKITSKAKDRAFLSEMVYEGKKLYAMRSFLTTKPEYEILSYTEEELNFARENERYIWEYFVKGEYIYSTDSKLLGRFLNPAPFSKFYLEFDNETPGRIGRYIGYEIVKSYMENNEVPLKTMLIQDAETIFASAKYKP